ncbi:hypothetical protein, partial [Pradoshia sp.]
IKILFKILQLKSKKIVFKFKKSYNIINVITFMEDNHDISQQKILYSKYSSSSYSIRLLTLSTGSPSSLH